MDPLSDVLSLVKPHHYGSGVLSGGGRYAFHFEGHAGIKCYVVVKGACIVVVDGVKKPAHLATGDALMLPHGRAFRLCSDLRTRSVDARVLLKNGVENGMRRFAPGDDLVILGGHFALEGNAQVLLSVLPPLVHLQDEDNALRAPVERIAAEMRNPQPGGALIAQQSAYTMLVLVLRMFLAQTHSRGWLAALSHPQIARAMARMHDKPAHRWTVQKLATASGMSRSTFAEAFQRTVGEPPLQYLTRWRMLLASERLHRDAVGDVARALGYESESAFSAAFKRMMGKSPRAFAKARTAAKEETKKVA